MINSPTDGTSTSNSDSKKDTKETTIKTTSTIDETNAQPPYTAHSFLLPATVTSNHESNAGNKNSVALGAILPAPLSAPPVEQQGSPMSVAPYHGDPRHLVVASSTGSGGKADIQAPTLMVKPGATATAFLPMINERHMPATSFLIPHPLSQEQIALERRKLRSGKWVPEEEEYAMLLVRLFEQGMLSDCCNGSTLRSYLSKKLNCAPMRISKKFAGKGIGKMVYASKFLSPGTQILRKLQQAEETFKQATFPATHCFLPATMGSLVPSEHTLSTQLVVHKSLATSLPAISSAMAAPSVFGVASLAPRPLTKVQPVQATSVQSVPQPYQLFPLSAQQQQHLQALVQQQQRNLQQVAVVEQPTVENPKNEEATPPAAPVVPQQGSHKVGPSSVEAQDLLSGFDKVVKNPEAATIVAPVGDAHSPPFTSRSFDDFHRFLGKDLTLLEDSEKQPSAPLFVEESYRMLSMDQQPHDTAAFRLIADGGTDTEAIDGVLDVVSSEPSLFIHDRNLTSAAVVSEATDGTETNSSDSDASDGPVRKRTKTESCCY